MGKYAPLNSHYLNTFIDTSIGNPNNTFVKSRIHCRYQF
ncbi:protein of unknown function [Shewanella benthica]|uniref:Uncharacterized protein n=1 Tax=Shewanella benthica TaxID=43661 RepID=A0A330M329_9GAMM|nr:protein of unknown function [Shewanella benthica]